MGNKKRQFTGDGARLYELLSQKFESQKAVAEALNVKQNTVSVWLNSDKLTFKWHKKYAYKLYELGLNAAYIQDPTAHALLQPETI